MKTPHVCTCRGKGSGWRGGRAGRGKLVAHLSGSDGFVTRGRGGHLRIFGLLRRHLRSRVRLGSLLICLGSSLVCLGSALLSRCGGSVSLGSHAPHLDVVGSALLLGRTICRLLDGQRRLLDGQRRLRLR